MIAMWPDDFLPYMCIQTCICTYKLESITGHTVHDKAWIPTSMSLDNTNIIKIKKKSKKNMTLYTFVGNSSLANLLY